MFGLGNGVIKEHLSGKTLRKRIGRRPLLQVRALLRTLI
jgi:hypothetical protein